MRKTNEGKTKYTCVAIRRSRVHRWTKLSVRSTDYGRPMKPFFIEIQNFWAWAVQKTKPLYLTFDSLKFQV